MTKDTWYKRLLWFLFFSCITLFIFFIIDTLIDKIGTYYLDNTFTASFTSHEYRVSSDLVTIEFITDADTYHADLFINEENTLIELNNTNKFEFKLSELPFELENGTYTVKTTITGKKTLGSEKEILITTKLVIE